MTDSDASADVDPEAYAAELERKREEKDDFFASHPQSPIPPAERDSFDGLDYFDPDTDARVAATATVHDDPEPVTMETTAGNEVRYLRLVTFAFELDGESVELHGYQQEREDDEAIFVPFRDKTTGQQSYRNGRYVELHPDGDLTDGDTVVLDLNLAYTPFCAYSDTFACPLPPEENWLDVSVEAGERDYENASQ
ncbi:DUF1684 domain-containing protein [Halogeometricum limi]|uniref:DUF1684 domain-containing protein n=1 Tax=Halogeometricum limi TaxID=555875 RepID=A0A1I6HMT5_9EURY|nr:DUF1684 domain-containing protein [Halogeometricum limi]SFR55752.1 hypothetical protein SAMN04488124_2409 [Halogeometricum limi]